jgi:hypothetical protein
MTTQGDSLIKKTQKGLSILAFETTKQSRILKKRMRIAALQKETKADLRDLGNLVYNAILNNQAGILEEEEVKILVDNIRTNKGEVERLREGIARLGRARKHFHEGEEETAAWPSPRPDEEPPLVVEPSPGAPGTSEAAGVTTEPEVEETAPQPAAGEEPERLAPRSADLGPDQVESTSPSIPPGPGADRGGSREEPGEAEKP